jgi:hypothetical protein
MSRRSATSRPCDMVWVDGSLGTVVVLLHRGVRSPRIVACPVHMSDSSTPYCHRPAASTSCMHLIPVIRCVWSVTYVFNVLPHRVYSKAMMGLMSIILRTHGYVRRPRATWHVATSEPSRTRRGGGGSGATGHVAVPEPYRAVVLVTRSRGDARAFLRRGRV